MQLKPTGNLALLRNVVFPIANVRFAFDGAHARCERCGREATPGDGRAAAIDAALGAGFAFTAGGETLCARCAPEGLGTVSPGRRNGYVHITLPLNRRFGQYPGLLRAFKERVREAIEREVPGAVVFAAREVGRLRVRVDVQHAARAALANGWEPGANTGLALLDEHVLENMRREGFEGDAGAHPFFDFLLGVCVAANKLPARTGGEHAAMNRDISHASTRRATERMGHAAGRILLGYVLGNLDSSRFVNNDVVERFAFAVIAGGRGSRVEDAAADLPAPRWSKAYARGLLLGQRDEAAAWVTLHARRHLAAFERACEAYVQAIIDQKSGDASLQTDLRARVEKTAHDVLATRRACSELLDRERASGARLPHEGPRRGRGNVARVFETALPELERTLDAALTILEPPPGVPAGAEVARG